MVAEVSVVGAWLFGVSAASNPPVRCGAGGGGSTGVGVVSAGATVAGAGLALATGAGGAASWMGLKNTV